MDNQLFKVDDGGVSLAGLTFKYPKISPSGDGFIDVLRKYTWKHSITKYAISEVPAIRLKEYTLAYGKWMQNLVSAFTNAGSVIESKGANIDPYAFLYTGVPTKFQYLLPNLIKPGSTLKGSINNEWRKIDLLEEAGNMLPPDLGGDFVKGLSKLEKGAQSFIGGFGYEQLRSYTGTAPRTLNISFPLYNTVDMNSTIQNFRFIHLFALQNLKVRTTFLTYMPPKIYEVIPDEKGGPYMAAAYVSKYDVSSIGATRSIKIGGNNHLVPEAYKVTISLTDLIDPSTNIEIGSTHGDRRVSVVQSREDIDPATIASSIATQAYEEFNKTIGYVGDFFKNNSPKQ